MIVDASYSSPVPRRMWRARPGPRLRPLLRRPVNSKQSKHWHSMPTGHCSTFSRLRHLCEQLYPGKGSQLAQICRVKQLQYSLMRSLMGRHRDFWGLTEDGLVWASKNLQLELTPEKKKQLMEAYLSLAAFPDVKPGLEALKK